MKLNFYLEGAGLILGIILCFATGVRYNIIDLKDKIYVHVVRIVTVMLGLNMVSYFIVRKNLFGLLWLAEIIICLSFLFMVLLWFYLNSYLLELIYNRNYFSVKMYLVLGMPFFLNLLLILANWGTHKVFDVAKVEGVIQIVFNSWYKIPYGLAIFSLITYLMIIIKNYRKVCDMKQYIFFIVPFVMIIIYYLQYRFKSIAILGFGYVVILIMLYIYSYNYFVKIDNLTHLPDGDTFKKMLDYRIGSNQNMVVAMVTLDDFKRVNYEYGYNNGNKFITAIAKYLEENSPKKCISRYGGDKFAIIFENYTEQDIQIWCENILERFKNSWHIGKLTHKLSICIALVEYPRLAENSAEIVELLEYLNTYAKKNKKNQCIICDDAFKEKMKRKMHIVSILKEVMQDGKVYVEYQPILDVKENRYNRAEALFRLKDDYFGDIAPGEFFPIAEENGYVIEIGYLLIDKVCQYIYSFIMEGKEAPIVSVNFSRQQIMAEDVDIRIMDILQKYQLSPECIAIELPEEVFSVQYDAVKEQMMKLYANGIRFYLDGFGKGFLDLLHLMELPFEIIKISKNMIKEAENKDSIYLLVSAMTAVFEENGKQILGDGIESEHLKEIADLLFMDYLQGYYFCEPISGEKAKEQFIKKNVLEMSELDEMLSDMVWDSSLVSQENEIL